MWSGRAVSFDEERVEAIFAGLDQCRPGAAVGIAIGGTPVYRKGFGLAGLAPPVVLSPSTGLRIYATTKPLTGLACLLLCEEGRAGLDDPIGKYLPEMHPVTHGVTMRQLMGHTGGLRDVLDLHYQFDGTGFVSEGELLSLYRDIDDANFAPGTNWAYNNGGYLMLGAAIERIAARTLAEVLRERIFAPLRMHGTLLHRSDADVMPDSAAAHMPTPAGGFEEASPGAACAGAGGVVSSVDNLLAWLAHMEAPSVGSASTWHLMKTPQTLPNGTSTGYGLGLMSGRYRGVDTLHHTGAGLGGSAQMLKVPAAGLDVVVLVNRHDVSAAALADRILDVCLPDLEPVRTPARCFLDARTFRSPATDRVVQLRLAHGSPLAMIDGLDVPVEPDEAGVLRPTRAFAFLNLALTLLGDRQHPAAIRLDEFGHRDDLLPVPPAAEPDVRAIAGRYRSKTTGIEATIVETGSGVRLGTAGRFGSAAFALECLGEGLWRSRATGPVPWGGVLVFDAAAATFRFSSLSTRALSFSRV